MPPSRAPTRHQRDSPKARHVGHTASPKKIFAVSASEVRCGAAAALKGDLDLKPAAKFHPSDLGPSLLRGIRGASFLSDDLEVGALRKHEGATGKLRASRSAASLREKTRSGNSFRPAGRCVGAAENTAQSNALQGHTVTNMPVSTAASHHDGLSKGSSAKLRSCSEVAVARDSSSLGARARGHRVCPELEQRACPSIWTQHGVDWESTCRRFEPGHWVRRGECDSISDVPYDTGTDQDTSNFTELDHIDQDLDRASVAISRLLGHATYAKSCVAVAAPLPVDGQVEQEVFVARLLEERERAVLAETSLHRQALDSTVASLLQENTELLRHLLGERLRPVCPGDPGPPVSVHHMHDNMLHLLLAERERAARAEYAFELRRALDRCGLGEEAGALLEPGAPSPGRNLEGSSDTANAADSQTIHDLLSVERARAARTGSVAVRRALEQSRLADEANAPLETVILPPRGFAECGSDTAENAADSEPTHDNPRSQDPVVSEAMGPAEDSVGCCVDLHVHVEGVDRYTDVVSNADQVQRRVPHREPKAWVNDEAASSVDQIHALAPHREPVAWVIDTRAWPKAQITASTPWHRKQRHLASGFRAM